VVASGKCFKRPKIPEYQLIGSISEAAAVQLRLPDELPTLTPLDDAIGRKNTEALGLPAGTVALEVNRNLYRHTGAWGDVLLPVQ
jgi:hypothetical protein